MQVGYFKTAWSDVKNSKGWFGKILLLSLVALIPVFGAIAVAGYLYGWARDIAWGIHGPMPKRLFGNEDGKLYSRGFFVLVIGFVFALLPWAIELVWGLVMGFSSLTFGHGYSYGYLNGGTFVFGGFMTLIFTALTIAATFVALLFQWVGSMRMSIYGRLSAGFQFNKMWAMIRHDFGGLMRIFGMCILLSAIISVIISIVFFFVVAITVFIGIAATGGNMRADHLDGTVIGWIIAFGGIAIVGMLLASYVSVVACLFVGTLVTRSLGYWTRQFDVPAWRGQDDPMPFELQAAAARQAQQPYQAAGSQGYGGSQPGSQYGQPIYQQTPPQSAPPQASHVHAGAYPHGANPSANETAAPSEPTGGMSDTGGESGIPR